MPLQCCSCALLSFEEILFFGFHLVLLKLGWVDPSLLFYLLLVAAADAMCVSDGGDFEGRPRV